MQMSAAHNHLSTLFLRNIRSRRPSETLWSHRSWRPFWGWGSPTWTTWEEPSYHWEEGGCFIFSSSRQHSGWISQKAWELKNWQCDETLEDQRSVECVILCWHPVSHSNFKRMWECFFISGHALTNRRKGFLPSNLEAQRFLLMNREVWG